MTDLVEHRRQASQTLGVYCLRASDMIALLDEIERLRGILADIKCGAVNITMAKQMAARALEPKT